MAAFQIESNICTGRGFIDTSATGYSGYLAHFYQWITTPVISGGAGWYMLRNMSTLPTAKTVVPTQGANGYFTCSGHGFVNGDQGIITATGTICAGYNNGYTYYVHKIDDNKFHLFDSIKSTTTSPSGTYYPSSSGVGSQVFTSTGPYIIVSNRAAPKINEVCLILKVGYWTAIGSTIYMQGWLNWDSTNQCVNGLWMGNYIDTQDAADFVYDFRGGEECMILQSRISSTWDTCLVDTWTGDSNFLESASKSGVLSAGVTAGTNVSIPLFSGESLNFTSGEYYFMCDWQQGHNWVNYAKCLGVSGLSITLDNVYNNYPSGSIIGSYPHRFYALGTDTGDVHDLSWGTPKIPYYSSTLSGYVSHAQTADRIYGQCLNDTNTNILSRLLPDDKGKYAIQRVNILENTRPNDGYYGTYNIDMNRFFGSAKNTFVTVKGTMLAGSDGRSYGGKNYLYFQQADQVITGGGTSNGVLLPDTETTS